MGCVSRVYTDVAVFDITPDGVAVLEIYGEDTIDTLRETTGLALIDATVPVG